MVPDTSLETRSTPAKGYSTPINALLGAVVGIVLSVVPLSPVLGGAVAGYLEGGRPDDGLRVGALAGVVMFVPFPFVLFAALYLIGYGLLSLSVSLLAVFVLVVSAVYTIGLSVLGGYLGVYLRDEL